MKLNNPSCISMPKSWNNSTKHNTVTWTLHPFSFLSPSLNLNWTIQNDHPYHLSFLLPSKTWTDHPNMHRFEITKNSPLCIPCHNFESHSAHSTQWLKHSLHWTFNTTQQLKHSLPWSFNTTQRLKSSLHWSFLFPLQCKLELKIQCTSPFYNYEQSLCTPL